MAADTGKKNNLAIHLDKIAYGAAILLGLVILFLPTVATSGIEGTLREISERRDEVRNRQGSETPPVEPVPPLPEIVKTQWEIPSTPPGPWITPWAMEPRPGEVRVFEGVVGGAASHEKGKVVKVTYERDPARRQVVLRVECARGAVSLCKFVRTKLLRAEVAEAGDLAFTEVADLDAEPLVYRDQEVVAGKKYAYKLLTEVDVEASGRVKATLAPDEKVKESEACALRDPVPFDYAMKIITATPFDAQSGNPPKMNGELLYWDYGQKKLIQPPKSVWTEGDVFGEKLSGKERYLIKSIDDNKVTVQERMNLKREPLSQITGRRPVELPKDFECEPAIVDVQVPPDPNQVLNGGPVPVGAGEPEKASGKDKVVDEDPRPKKASPPKDSTKTEKPSKTDKTKDKAKDAKGKKKKKREVK